MKQLKLLSFSDTIDFLNAFYSFQSDWTIFLSRLLNNIK